MRSRRRLWPSILLCVLGAGGADANELRLACAPDKPAAVAGETIAVHAWIDPPVPKNVQYTWTAPKSRIEANAASASWNLGGLEPGAYAAKVRAGRPGAEPVECDVVVIVRPDAQRKGLIEGRNFLLRRNAESAGYGLYTYLLLGSRAATAEHRTRQIKVLESFLRIDNILALEKFHEVKLGLNIAYLPLTEPPPEELLAQAENTQYAKLAEWALGRYDYERASVLLHRLDHLALDRNGIYIVSDLAPLSVEGASERVLYQALTTTPPDYAWAYIQYFLALTTQQPGWTSATLQKLALDTRTMMSSLAQGYEGMTGKLDGILGWAGKH